MVPKSNPETRFLCSSSKRKPWKMRKTKSQKFEFPCEEIGFEPLHGAYEQSRSKCKFTKARACFPSKTHTRGSPIQVITTEPNPAQEKKRSNMRKTYRKIRVFEQRKLVLCRFVELPSSPAANVSFRTNGPVICFVSLRGAADQCRSKLKFVKERARVSGNMNTRGNPSKPNPFEPNPTQPKQRKKRSKIRETKKQKFDFPSKIIWVCAAS